MMDFLNRGSFMVGMSINGMGIYITGESWLMKEMRVLKNWL